VYQDQTVRPFGSRPVRQSTQWECAHSAVDVYEEEDRETSEHELQDVLRSASVSFPHGRNLPHRDCGVNLAEHALIGHKFTLVNRWESTRRLDMSRRVRTTLKRRDDVEKKRVDGR
jgi:hypothetical protein